MTTSILRGAALLTLALAVVALPAQAASKAAPAFTLELFNGKTISLGDLKGMAVVLLFWAPW
jgi:type III secretory pathway component EscT